MVDKIKRRDGGSAAGEYDPRTDTITIKKNRNTRMDNALMHEIQHAIDFRSGMRMDMEKKAHPLRTEEQNTRTNDVLYHHKRH
jgi:hypothetical protein